MNQLGYSCVTFDLYKSGSPHQSLSYVAEKPLIPFYKTHVQQISDVLESVKGPKIVFCFSGPSLAGLIATSTRSDVVAYICDGGPFREMWACTYRMFHQLKIIPTRPLQAIGTTLSFFLWGVNSFSEFKKALKHWPKKVPILSLRGQQDTIVHLENIENAFKDQPDLPITVVELPGVGHLDGLKKFPKEYETVVKQFLEPLT
jgi:pimeloyl-ACP methyl ester carboxylesterase